MENQIRDKGFLVNVSKEEYLIFQKLAKSHRTSMATLLRECTLTDFAEQQVTIKANDVFDFCQLQNLIDIYTHNIISGIINNGQPFVSEIKKIQMLNEDLQSMTLSIYNDIETVRTRIGKEVAGSLKRNHRTGWHIKEDTLDYRIYIRISEDESEQIQEQAEFEDKSMSQLLKDNVMSKCLTGLIVIDSYPLNEFNKAIENQLKIYKGISIGVQNKEVTERDVKNVLLYLEKFNTLFKEFDNSILTEQSDIRREARKILKERRSNKWQ